jgi:hypothetical protein
VTVYPIGIGQLGGTTITPTMVTTVSDKRANPLITSPSRGASGSSVCRGMVSTLPARGT